VWKTYIYPSKHKEIYIVAHSAGGACLSAIQSYDDFGILTCTFIIVLVDTFYQRTKKIALTDSWALSKDRLKPSQLKFMRENCVHYLASSKPLGAELPRSKAFVCTEVSAGHEKHEYTTGYAYPEIYKHFEFTL
jgi:hypothetical protein